MKFKSLIARLRCYADPTAECLREGNSCEKYHCGVCSSQAAEEAADAIEKLLEGIGKSDVELIKSAALLGEIKETLDTITEQVNALGYDTFFDLLDDFKIYKEEITMKKAIAGCFTMIQDPEDQSKTYAEFPDGLRLIFRDGKYIGWYNPNLTKEG